MRVGHTLARRRSCHGGRYAHCSRFSCQTGARCRIARSCHDVPGAAGRGDGPGHQGRNHPPGAGGQAAHGHAAGAERRGENREPSRGLGMAHWRAPRGISGARLCLSRRRVRRRPRRAEAVRRRRRDQCDRRLFDQQLLAGADRRVAAVLRVEPRTGVADGTLPGRARREVLRHRPGLGQGRQDILRLHAVGRRRTSRLRRQPVFVRGRRRQLHRHRNRFRRHRAVDRGTVLTSRQPGPRARPVQVRQQHRAGGRRLAAAAGLRGLGRAVSGPVRRLPRDGQRPGTPSARSRRR